MKMTKSVMISAVILAGILFTGCPGGAGGNGGTSGKTKDVIKIIDGKSAEVNYTNNTNETQKFRVYVNSKFPKNAAGQFYLYDQPTNSPYEFGFFFDFEQDTRSTDDVLIDEFALIKLNVNNIDDGYTRLKWYLGKIACEADVFDNYLENFDFESSDHLEKSNVIDFDSGKDYDSSHRFEITTSSINDRYIKYNYLINSFKTGDKPFDSKFGYYLILPPGSTCHLKFIITETN